MHLARVITILVVGLAIWSAAPPRVSAQSEPEADSDIVALPAATAAVIEQHALAQSGLGQAFMFRLLQAQLHMIDADDDGIVGKCRGFPFGGSVSLKRQVGTFVRQSTVNMYYDATCHDLFIAAVLTVDENPTNHFDIVETATFYKPPEAGKPKGPVSGKLTLHSVSSRTSTVTHITGTGTWTPTGGTKVQGAVKCDYPRKFKAGKSFTCSFAMAQPSKLLRRDLASAAVLTFKVAKAPLGTFDGDFKGTVQLFTGASGKLGVAVPANGAATVSGPHKPLATATADGLVRLLMFWPPPSSWSLIDAAHGQSFAIAMASVPPRDSSGGITQGSKTLATFSVDKAGEGQITYSDRSKAKIVNWIPVN